MKKSAFLFLLLLSVIQLYAQRRSQIQLTSSLNVKIVPSTGRLTRFIRPVFTHEGSTLAADSADYSNDANAFDAFGHVVITQPDGTVIYADQLNYDGNTRIAILTRNVRMVDKDATLTTNYLTYNMGSKIGTYIGGGKIENGQNIVVSKNGWYFANSRDAYFRYDVVVNTPDSEIKTDTLKYNSESKIAWFFGPTNIYGKGQNKESKLYTENGRYNTLTDQAWFGKKNLYTEGTKSLTGDSLFYDGKAGFGKAINNITFRDTSDKAIILKGNQGIYNKKDESALVTLNAYVVMEVEQDSAKVDSIWMTADTLFTKLIRMKDLVPATKEDLKSDEEVSTDPVIEGDDAIVVSAPAVTTAPAARPAPVETPKAAPAKRRGGLLRKRSKEPAEPVVTDSTANTQKVTSVPEAPGGDSLAVQRRGTVLAARDTTAADTVTAPDEKLPAVKTDAAKKDTTIKDTIPKIEIPNPQDTVLTRVVHAYHNVKIFKSDLQSRSDSAFYSYADSIIRCYRNPIIWTQGSQLTADTIYLQLKDRKLDNMLLQHNGFIVSAEGDSSKYNQVKGKVITGVFEDSKLTSMFVDGNAESIYYTFEDSIYTGVNRSLSSRMRLTFADNKLQQVMFVRKPEGKYYPIEKVPEDIEILEGFIWKPKDRPKSKEEIIPTLAKKTAPAKKAAPPVKGDPPPAKIQVPSPSATAKPQAAVENQIRADDAKMLLTPSSAEIVKDSTAVKK